MLGITKVGQIVSVWWYFSAWEMPHLIAYP